MIYLAICFLFIAGLAKSVSDLLDNYKFEKSIFRNLNPQFWDTEKSWRNKWKKGPDGKIEANPRPKFLFSTTLLCWTTDAWHLFNAVQYGAKLSGVWAIAMVNFDCSATMLFIYCALIYRLTFGLSFEIGFYAFTKRD